MHVLGSMNRKELTITIIAFLVIAVLWIYGIYLIASSALNYREVETSNFSPVLPTSSLLTDPAPTPSQEVITALQDGSVQPHEPTKSINSENLILAYLTIVVILTVVAIYFWRKFIYLPVKVTIYALSVIEPVGYYNSTTPPW